MYTYVENLSFFTYWKNTYIHHNHIEHLYKELDVEATTFVTKSVYACVIYNTIFNLFEIRT